MPGLPIPDRCRSRSSTLRPMNGGGSGPIAGRSHGGFSTAPAACPARVPPIILRCGGCCGRPRSNRSATCMACSGPLYERLWRPLLLAALNTEPSEAAAGLAAATLRESLARGGRASRPLIAWQGLSEVFVAPALEFLQAHGGAIRYGDRLRAMTFGKQEVAQLDFGDEGVRLAPDDSVVLAVPPWVAVSLVPGLEAPMSSAPSSMRISWSPLRRRVQPMIGVVNGTTNGFFPSRNVLPLPSAPPTGYSMSRGRPLPHDLWDEVAAVTGMEGTAVPPWQIIKERRATFAALPTRERQTAGEPRRDGAIWSSPATGPRPACRRPSKARSAPATARRNIAGGACTGHDGMSNLTDSFNAVSAHESGRPVPTWSSASRRPLRHCSTASNRTDIGFSNLRPMQPYRPNMCCLRTFWVSRPIPGSRVRLPPICAAFRQQHGGWPLFHGGKFDMSASVKAYFALKMIGDSPAADHMRRAREAISPMAALPRATCSRASCWRCSARCRGAACPSCPSRSCCCLPGFPFTSPRSRIGREL